MSIADQIAAHVGARHSGGWWRTSTAHCHGGDSAGGLAFRSPDDQPDRLQVHCHTHGCHEKAEGRNRARDNLRAAAGLPEWRPGSRSAALGPPTRPKTTFSAPIGARTGAENRSERSSARGRDGKSGDTGEYAAALWQAARPSTQGPGPGHPVAYWLQSNDLWPPGHSLPEPVRWLPASNPRFPRGQPGSTAAGALVLALRPPFSPFAPVRKVQLVAIDAAGEKCRHWPDADKRTYGAGRWIALLARDLSWPHAPRGLHLHACEGLKDGLRILRYEAGRHVVAVCAGKGYFALDGWHAWFEGLVLWPDGDEAGFEAARKAGQDWKNRGLTVEIKRVPPGHDPASAPLQ